MVCAILFMIYVKGTTKTKKEYKNSLINGIFVLSWMNDLLEP